jgi:LmbE family N-acetylglucosaminyl deacetylase
MTALPQTLLRCCAALLALLLLAGPAPLPAETPVPGKVLVVTADSADYLAGAGGTLAQLALDGFEIHVAHFGNDEKESAGLSPAETRWANTQEGKAAAEYLGFRDAVYMEHKTGEIGYVSSTEMRNQLFALIRYLRPNKIFIPDPYVHFQPDWDVYFVGRMAEEAWGYSGGSTFAPELARMSLAPYSVPEVYYYPVDRPYRPAEGGEQNARLVGVDISGVLDAKATALAMLRTRNRSRAQATRARLRAAGHSIELLEPLDEKLVQALTRAWVHQLAATMGEKHGFRYGEEFNYVGRGEAIPPHALERAVPK